MSNEKLKGHGLIFIANILFAINLPISKYLLPSHVSPEALTLLRMLFGCVMFWVVSLFVKKEKVSLKDLGLLFICAMCGIAINQSVFLAGLNKTSPVDASIIATAGPIYVMLLAALILKEPITKKKTFGVMLGVIGGVTLILSSTQAESQQAGDLKGDLMIVFSNFMYSIYAVVSRPLSQRYSAVTIMKWMFLFSSIVLLPIMYQGILDMPAWQRNGIDWEEALAISYVLFFATFIPYLLIPMSLKRLRPTTVSMYNYVQPIVASFIAVMVGQDTFTIGKFLSTALVFVGVYLVTQSKSREDVLREQESKGNDDTA